MPDDDSGVQSSTTRPDPDKPEQNDIPEARPGPSQIGLQTDKVYETRSPGQDLSAEQLRDVAQTLGRRWEKAALHLGLTNEDLDYIKEEEMAEFMQRRKMLRLWKRRRPGKATAQDLLRGLEGLKVLPVKTRLLLDGNVFNPNPGSS
ncbi:unnamed protein product [Boreogadus saida]